MEGGKIKDRFSYTEFALFLVQILAVFVVVCACLINLTMEWGNQHLWILLLTVSLGYIMPNPKMEMLSEIIGKYKGDVESKP